MTITAPGKYIRHTVTAYRNGSDQPLPGYAGAMAVYAAATVAGAAWLRAAGRRLPSRVGPYDVATLAMATHKLSRTASKSGVTSPLRAPFTRFEENGGPGEVNESVRGDNRSVRHTLGELLSCPFCLDVWIVTGLAMGLVRAPRATRFAASALSALAGADFLHLAYAKAQGE